MLKQSVILGAVMAASLAVFAHAQQPQVQPSPLQPSPVKRTPLGKVDVPGSNYEVVFGITELAAGFKSGRHSHPGLVMAYIIDGDFWFHLDGEPEKVYRIGEAFQYAHSAIHNEGAAGDKPVKVMAVFVVEKGKPLVQPAQ